LWLAVTEELERLIINNKKAIILTTIGVVIGALSGFLYYAEIGCISGTCTITS
tara:strand:+ start:2273 stop:2431 length:159 start_codon:yes stop_codon:yes gene_type:complete